MTLQSLDTNLLLFCNRGIINSWFDVLMPVLSYQGYLLATPFLIYIIIRGSIRDSTEGKRHILTALSTIVIACGAVYLGVLTEDFLKEQIGRMRPCKVIEGIRLISNCPKSFSMPSGHAISSFAFALPLYYMTRVFIPWRWRIYPLVLASMIAFSRLYLGVHYPADVMAGALLGATIGITLSWLHQKIFAGRR